MAYDFTAASSQYFSNNSSPLGSAPTSFTLAGVVNGAAQDDKFVIAIGSSTSNAPAIALSTGASVASQNNSHLRGFIRRNDFSYVSGEVVAGGAAGVAFNSSDNAIALTYDGSNAVTYINGVVGTNVSGAISTLNGLNRFAIGGFLRNSFAAAFNGRIAEVGIWNAALTQPEIASLAKGMTCDKVRPQSLVFYAPLVRNLIDAKGGLTITNNNGATVADHPRVYA